MKSVDYRSFGLGGPAEDRRPDDVDRQWWTLPPDEAAASISSTLSLFRQHQAERERSIVVGARLYGNLSLLPGVHLGKLSTLQAAQRERLTFNVVQSAIDTVTAKIAKNRPRPLFLTSGGDYRQQRRAKRLTQFVDGVFYEAKAYELGPEAFRDACIWGDGLVHVFARHGRVAFERVLPGELFVDELEALYGNPRQMHRVKQVDRAVLLALFPGKAGVIGRADREGDASERRPGHVADLVTVRESWRLPSKPGAKDGKHVLTVDGHALTPLEPWEHDFFPFARFSWSRRPFGFWAQGLAEQLAGIQLELNKLFATVQRSLHLSGTFKIWVKNGSKVAVEHLNNEIGAVLRSEEPPQWILPQAVQPEVYAQINTLIARAYEQAGVSQLSATAQKPAGLNSGKALREYNDIETDRFQTVGQAYERFFLDLARLSIAVAKGIAARDNGYRVQVPGRKWLASIDWADVDLAEDQYVMQCFPVSSLPRDPAGRLQTVQEYAQAGYLTPRQARRLLDFPDLDQVESLENAAEEYLTQVLDQIVDDGDYAPPEPFDDLALGRELALEYYQLGRTQGLEEERLELLRRFITQIDDYQRQAAQPPTPPAEMPPSDPTAPPGAPQPMPPQPAMLLQ